MSRPTSLVDWGLAVESNMIANGINRTVKNTVVAKSLMLGVILVARPFINIKKRMGLSKVPWGTPKTTGDHEEAGTINHKSLATPQLQSFEAGCWTFYDICSSQP